MQFTFAGELAGLSGEDKSRLDSLMQRYCSAKRTAFNRLLPPRRYTVKDVIHHLEKADTLALNGRYCNHAARQADAELKSQEELLPLYLTDTLGRMEETERKGACALCVGIPLRSRGPSGSAQGAT